MKSNVLAQVTAVTLSAIMGSCASVQPTQQDARPARAPKAPVDRVTLDIQDGIESHIRSQTLEGGGLFDLQDDDETLHLKLVRVHTEYLSQLGPGYSFACVDLATSGGDVFDVDFFLRGEPGAMHVTETTIHKKNGQPRYVWEQEADKTWVRVDVEAADPELLGVIRGHDSFHFVYQATLPDIEADARVWLPIATNDAFQTVEILSILAPESYEFLDDEVHGNKILFMELGPRDSGKTIEIQYAVERSEKAVYEAREAHPEDNLAPERLVPSTPEFKAIAAEVVEGKDGDLVRARALYDHVIDALRYAKVGTEYGHGDANFACDSGGGNCTDYHSYFIALAREVGIPARFAIGASIPSSRNEGGINGYHCWAEFYSEDHWWPVDISEADKCTGLSSFYFGHHPANRIELSRGRDLEVEPSPASGPINFLAYPLLEVAGTPVKTKIDFSFERRIEI
jgi:transglutaminase-like putative cysteine protease